MTLTQKMAETTISLVVGELVRMRKSFTGRDVFDRIHNKNIRRLGKLPNCTLTAGEVSRHVRKLFNSHQDFNAYGSALADSSGPVVYFALPHHAKAKISKIADEFIYGGKR